MIRVDWRKRVSILRNRLYFYPAPEPMVRTRLFWIAMGCTTGAIMLFCCYFMLYLIARHDAFLTNAEDFGIMDQAIWNTVHGHILHQTICNIVNDTNCYSPQGIMRFAIHFEPILFPISLLYLIWPSAKVLLILQTLVVASGAYPAFWLARLRLRNEVAAVGIALLYLLYPALQQATVYDFHAVTFTASLLLFMLYFMYTRRTVWLFVFAILAMACKEEIPLVVAMFGVWSIVFQQRWRSGLALALMGTIWFVLVFFLVMPHFSPTGHPLLQSRYDNLGKGPMGMLSNVLGHPRHFFHQYVLDRAHRAYLQILFSPAGYLPLLAPWILVLALPSVAINLLSSNMQMYSGLFQYNAEIVPVLIFATIEAIVLIVWLAQLLLVCFQMMSKGEREEGQSQQHAHSWKLLWPKWSRHAVHLSLLDMLVIFALVNAVWGDYSFYGNLPFSKNFAWPTASAHTTLAYHFIDMIPPDASVSAQTKLVPHLSHREDIYMFPYADKKAEYILLDVTGDIYPYANSTDYTREVSTLLQGGTYSIMAEQDGYVLLKRGLPNIGSG